MDGRPHVTLKLAVSADGKAGLAGRRPVAITGEVTNARVHLLRAMNDAILVGIGTVLSDDPLLTCRLPGMAARSPVRVVLDAGLRTPVASKLARTAAETLVWLMAAKESSGGSAVLERMGVEIMRAPVTNGRIDLRAALNALAGRGITRLLVEGGPTVAAAFLAADLVDEAVLLRSTGAIGPNGIDALEGQSLDALTQSPRLKSCGVESVGADTMEGFTRA
jgi:diaminohydroxyphosphoribosylaminopyrimidine deaminase/5-amino-6-(5-phosphoribosylamino)uracil reductase